MQWQQRLMALVLMGLPFAEVGAAPASATASTALTAPVSASASTATHLVVTTAQGDILVNERALPGTRWCIQWKHSVEHFTVLDCYRNVAGEMQLERSHQPDFAAGLGHIYGRGEQVSDGQGGYWINAIDEPVAGNAYLLRVGALAVNHQVVWPDGEHPPTSLSEQAAGQRVSIALQASP